MIKVVKGKEVIELLRVKCGEGKVIKVHMDISWSEATEVLKAYGAT